MVVCKFFLEGHCRFGPRCRFEHDNSYNQYEVEQSSDYNSERPSGTSVLRAETSSFSPRQDYRHQSSTQNASFGLKYSIHEIMQAVSRDVQQAESGNQWQLSVYSPLRELPNLPGLDDHSPEELRWECYKAAQNGSVPIWQAIVQQMYANVAKTNNELKKKDSGYAIIDMWLRGVEGKGLEANISSVGVNQATSSSFSGLGSASGGTTQPIFGSSQTNSSVFGGSSPSPGFGNTTSPSIFGGSSFPSPGLGGNNDNSFFGGNNITSPGFRGNNSNTSVFGGNSSMTTTGGFGGVNASPSVFGATNSMTTSPGFGAANASSSVFGATDLMTTSPGFGAANTSPSVFGGNTSNTMTSAPAFGANSDTSSMFGAGNSMATSGFGGNNTTSSIFGGSNMTSSGFGANNVTSSVFGGTTSIFRGENTSSVFGGNNTTIPSPNNSPFFSQTQMQPSYSPFSPQAASVQQSSPQSSMFGSNVSAFSSNQNTSPLPSLMESQHYSKSEELNEKDLAAFKAPKFTFGSIPTKPPPKALCGL